ncbi:MAG: PLP-dependent cysteine synthase family protein [Flavobacteriales bacterium]
MTLAQTLSLDDIHVGGTPLWRFNCLEASTDIRIYAKLEWMQFGGSVKARPAMAILRDAVASDAWKPGMRMVDATSGNTGIAYAECCRRAGLPLTLFLPANASQERKAKLRRLGVELVLTDAMEGTDGAQQAAAERASQYPNDYLYLDQYSNDANWKAHYDSTAPEILEQTDGALTHFVAGLGTTGTFTGTGRRLRDSEPALGRRVQLVALQPETSLHGMEGWKHLETAHVPSIYDASLPDAILPVSTESAYAMIQRIYRQMSLRLSPSGAANLAGTVAAAERFGPGTYVTILADDHTKYSALYKRLNIPFS